MKNCEFWDLLVMWHWEECFWWALIGIQNEKQSLGFLFIMSDVDKICFSFTCCIKFQICNHFLKRTLYQNPNSKIAHQNFANTVCIPTSTNLQTYNLMNWILLPALSLPPLCLISQYRPPAGPTSHRSKSWPFDFCRGDGLVFPRRPPVGIQRAISIKLCFDIRTFVLFCHCSLDC